MYLTGNGLFQDGGAPAKVSCEYSDIIVELCTKFSSSYRFINAKST